MKVLRMFGDTVNTRYIAEAVRVLEDGGLILYPTDTMYAVGCDALNVKAIEQLCRIKEIDPRKSSLSILCHDISQAAAYAMIDNRAFRILKEHLPGAFTFILPAATSLPRQFRHRKEVGIRIPDNKIARAVTEALGHPILTSGVSTGNLDEGDTVIPEEIADLYAPHGVELILDSGEGNVSYSTVVDIRDSGNPEILRQGKGIFNA